MVDFVKEGRVGDHVKHPTFGNGVITAIENGGILPVKTVLNGKARSFTRHGNYSADDGTPSLCFANGYCTIDQGTPPERFEYPLYRKNKHGMVVEFIGRKTGTVLIASDPCFPVGSKSDHFIYHEDDCWTPCEKPLPEPKPLQFDGTPKWAYVSNREDGYEEAVDNKRKRHVVAGNSLRGYAGIVYGNNNTEYNKITHWPYAWEIPADEAQHELKENRNGF